MPLPTHLHQQQSHDCGVACVAMAANVPYHVAREAFEASFLHLKKKGRPPYSSNFKNIQDVLSRLGCSSRMRRFRHWGDIQGPGIVKVDIGHPQNWHWVFSTREKDIGLVVLDPALPIPNIEYPTTDIDCDTSFDGFLPNGNWIEVQRH